MSRHTNTMAQYTNTPSTKPVGRIYFAEDVTDLKPVPPGALTSPPTPNRKLSIQEEFDPPRSYSDTTTGLRPILSNRLGQSNSAGSRSSNAFKLTKGSKPLPKLPFSNMNNQVQPQNSVNNPTAGLEEVPQTPTRSFPRNSLSIPLAISQRAGFKWPRPEGINVAKANGTSVPPGPKSAPTTSIPPVTTNNVHPQRFEPSMDDSYAAKGYSWARPKPLRLSNAPISPSENQFAQAAQASHQAIMTAALDAIHEKISSLDLRSDKLCASMDKLTKAVEILTQRLDGNPIPNSTESSNGKEENAQFEFPKQTYSARPSVTGSNYLSPATGKSLSPRLSEATLHGIPTPTTIKGVNIFGRDPFEVRTQSHGSNLSGTDEQVTEVRELLRKRSARGRQQSCWDPETDDDEELDTEDDDHRNSQSEYNAMRFSQAGEDGSQKPSHEHNASTSSWTSNPSPLTATSAYHYQPGQTGSQVPNLPILHEGSSLQPSPPPHPEDDSQERNEADRESRILPDFKSRPYSVDSTMLRSESPATMESLPATIHEQEFIHEQEISSDSPQLRPNSRDSRSSEYSISTDTTPQPPAFMSSLPSPPSPPSSTLSSPTPTPVHTTIASGLHNLKSTPSPEPGQESLFPAPPASAAPSAQYISSPFVDNSKDYNTTQFYVNNPKHSPSVSNRSYSSSISSNADTPPPRPAWYFFYGPFIDPLVLKELLNLNSLPTMFRARVWCCAAKYYGAYPAAVTVRDDYDKFIEGAAWYVSEKDMAEWLRKHEEKDGRMIEGEADIDFLERIPEIDRHGVSEGMVKGRMFLWKGDADQLMDHPII